MRYDSLADVPAAIRQQVEETLQKRLVEKQRRQSVRLPPAEFDSELEANYYLGVILPRLQSGEVAKCDKHETFLLLPAREYCGLKLPKVAYTPDFVLTYPDGRVEVVEVKSKAVRRLQKGYTYRRRLFIELVARPKGWTFREEIF